MAGEQKMCVIWDEPAWGTARRASNIHLSLADNVAMICHVASGDFPGNRPVKGMSYSVMG